MSGIERLIVIGCKCIGAMSRRLNIGAGATWPGEIALALRPGIARELTKEFRQGIILIAGTNGKTTTSLMIKNILEAQGDKIIHNASGANLLNGIVSVFINEARWNGNIKADWGVFEVDENTLPIVLKFIKFLKLNVVVVLLNLFRDQLDRYGEVDVIAEKWESALRKLPGDTKVILNADDPQVAHLGKAMKRRAYYFGLNDRKRFLEGVEHATDSTFCLHCAGRLTYDGIYYSHLGMWRCERCGEKRPKPDMSSWTSSLPGLYNQYNTLAAVSVGKTLGINDQLIRRALNSFIPAFGRQEEFVVNGKKVRILLSKNPAGFNASLRTVIEMGARVLLVVLNDRIPDGRDVSWIWDVDFEMIPAWVTVIVSGDRCYDMALRIKYARPKRTLPKGAVSEPETPILVYEKIEDAISFGVGLDRDTHVYILPTYSAMLEVRKILIGRKIL